MWPAVETNRRLNNGNQVACVFTGEDVSEEEKEEATQRKESSAPRVGRGDMFATLTQGSACVDVHICVDVCVHLSFLQHLPLLCLRLRFSVWLIACFYDLLCFCENCCQDAWIQ